MPLKILLILVMVNRRLGLEARTDEEYTYDRIELFRKRCFPGSDKKVLSFVIDFYVTYCFSRFAREKRIHIPTYIEDLVKKINDIYTPQMGVTFTYEYTILRYGENREINEIDCGKCAQRNTYHSLRTFRNESITRSEKPITFLISNCTNMTNVLMGNSAFKTFCDEREGSYLWIRHSAYDGVISAHEIGHVLGFDHHFIYPFIMYPYVLNNAKQFHEETKTLLCKKLTDLLRSSKREECKILLDYESEYAIMHRAFSETNKETETTKQISNSKTNTDSQTNRYRPTADDRRRDTDSQTNQQRPNADDRRRDTNPQRPTTHDRRRDTGPQTHPYIPNAEDRRRDTNDQTHPYIPNADDRRRDTDSETNRHNSENKSGATDVDQKRKNTGNHIYVPGKDNIGPDVYYSGVDFSFKPYNDLVSEDNTQSNFKTFKYWEIVLLTVISLVTFCAYVVIVYSENYKP